MSDFEFSVAKRRTTPITFKLGGDSLLEPAFSPEEGDSERQPHPAVYGPDPHEYVFTPPKNAVMMLPVIDPGEKEMNDLGMTKATFDWLGSGLAPSDNDRIIARLRDPNDDLDVEHLADVIQALTEKVAARPST